MYPNKPTLIAASIFALCKPADMPKGKQPPLWSDLPKEQQAPFLELAGFLLTYVHGAQLGAVERAKLAAVFEEKAKDTPAAAANANLVVSIFLSIAHLLA